MEPKAGGARGLLRIPFIKNKSTTPPPPAEATPEAAAAPAAVKPKRRLKIPFFGR